MAVVGIIFTDAVGLPKFWEAGAQVRVSFSVTYISLGTELSNVILKNVWEAKALVILGIACSTCGVGTNLNGTVFFPVVRCDHDVPEATGRRPTYCPVPIRWTSITNIVSMVIKFHVSWFDNLMCR